MDYSPETSTSAKQLTLFRYRDPMYPPFVGRYFSDMLCFMQPQMQQAFPGNAKNMSAANLSMIWNFNTTTVA